MNTHVGVDEMKALDFLKSIREDTPCEWTELDEAIAELEALQQPKSCEGCKHYKFTYKSNDDAVRQLMTTCSDCFRRLNRDNYESK